MARGLYVLVSALLSTTFCFSAMPVSSRSAGSLHAQSAAGTVAGTVTDASGAVIPAATVTIENPVSGLSRTAKTDSAGHYQFNNLPLNPYHLVANAPGFSALTTDVSVRSSVPGHATLSACRWGEPRLP